MIKQIFAIICGLMLMFPMTACGSYEANQPSVLSPPAASAPARTEGDERQAANSTESEENISSIETTSPEQTPVPEAPETSLPEKEDPVQSIHITVGSTTFFATLDDNEAAKELVKMLPLTINMSDYSGFEKVGSLETNLSTSNSNTTTQSGDIVLYNGNQIVIFYGSNSWSYTRLGRIDDLSGWEEALGGGDVTVTFSK